MLLCQFYTSLFLPTYEHEAGEYLNLQKPVDQIFHELLFATALYWFSVFQSKVSQFFQL
jgi:hypothetical protein